VGPIGRVTEALRAERLNWLLSLVVVSSVRPIGRVTEALRAERVWPNGKGSRILNWLPRSDQVMICGFSDPGLFLQPSAELGLICWQLMA
ncbi:hypothetical protein U1Q18_028796, partial [Sarracenia purpurea var. burkii]